jgi:hypothetical protein
LASFLRFAAFAVLMVGLLVFVVLPAVASPVLTQMVRDVGLRGDDLNVSIEYFDPSLLGGNAQSLTIRGRNVELPPALVGDLDLRFGNVSLIDRTFQTITGELKNVTLAAGGLTVQVASVQVDGPSHNASATGRFSADQTQQLVEGAARRAGLELEGVRLVDGGLRMSLGGLETRAGIAVQGGALVLSPDGIPPVLLMQPAPSDPWRLSEAFVSTAGVTVRGLFDATTLAGRLVAGPPDAGGSLAAP